MQCSSDGVNDGGQSHLGHGYMSVPNMALMRRSSSSPRKFDSNNAQPNAAPRASFDKKTERKSLYRPMSAGPLVIPEYVRRTQVIVLERQREVEKESEEHRCNRALRHFICTLSTISMWLSEETVAHSLLFLTILNSANLLTPSAYNAS